MFMSLHLSLRLRPFPQKQKKAKWRVVISPFRGRFSPGRRSGGYMPTQNGLLYDLKAMRHTLHDRANIVRTFFSTAWNRTHQSIVEVPNCPLDALCGAGVLPFIRRVIMSRELSIKSQQRLYCWHMTMCVKFWHMVRASLVTHEFVFFLLVFFHAGVLRVQIMCLWGCTGA